MTNIWGFLIQTLSVSVVAIILLFVKWLLNDKLSPRWQYGVSVVLAVEDTFSGQNGSRNIYNTCCMGRDSQGGSRKNVGIGIFKDLFSIRDQACISMHLQHA